MLKMTGVLRQKGDIKCNRCYNSLFRTDLQFPRKFVYVCILMHVHTDFVARLKFFIQKRKVKTD